MNYEQMAAHGARALDDAGTASREIIETIEARFGHGAAIGVDLVCRVNAVNVALSQIVKALLATSRDREANQPLAVAAQMACSSANQVEALLLGFVGRYATNIEASADPVRAGQFMMLGAQAVVRLMDAVAKQEAGHGAPR